MSNVNIGDKVVDINSGIEGRITDRLYSEARSQFVYVIKPSDGGRSSHEMRMRSSLPKTTLSTESTRISPIML